MSLTKLSLADPNRAVRRLSINFLIELKSRLITLYSLQPGFFRRMDFTIIFSRIILERGGMDVLFEEINRGAFQIKSSGFPIVSKGLVALVYIDTTSFLLRD